MKIAAIVFASLLLAFAAVAEAPAADAATRPTFNAKTDLISLHYDHAPDKDDGHSAAADRTMLETLFGKDWIAEHAVPVSGAYGKNRKSFNPKSDLVMDATWNERGGWLAAHDDWDGTAGRLVERWSKTLQAGGDVWVKDGGQSDLTADVVRRIKKTMPDIDTKKRIHVVQHSDWNERQTTDEDLAYVKAQTDYIRIRDANRYLNKRGGEAKFVESAVAHPVFGDAWKAAFEYYNPNHRLDFSDTGELLHIVGLGEMSIEAFRQKFLAR